MNRKGYINSFDRQLKAWDKDIAKLEKKAEKITRSLQQKIEALKHQRDAAAARTRDLLHSSEDAWQEVRHGAEAAFNDLRKAFIKAKAKFG
ncbi:MAG: hypothetical protein WCH05_08440 [Chlorobiaceae bacterium]